MSQTASGYPRKQKWYSRDIFPLIPLIETRKTNEYNATKLYFRWLIFTFWTLDSFEFELSVVANTHWGIGVIGTLPYLRWTITIPFFGIKKLTDKGLDLDKDN